MKALAGGTARMARGQSRPSKGTFGREAHRVEQETDQGAAAESCVRLHICYKAKTQGAPVAHWHHARQCKRLPSCGAVRLAALPVLDQQQHKSDLLVQAATSSQAHLIAHQQRIFCCHRRPRQPRALHGAAERQTPPADHFQQNGQHRLDRQAQGTTGMVKHSSHPT